MNQKVPFQEQQSRLRSAQSAAHSLVFQSLLPNKQNLNLPIKKVSEQTMQLPKNNLAYFNQTQISSKLQKGQNLPDQGLLQLGEKTVLDNLAGISLVDLNSIQKVENVEDQKINHKGFGSPLPFISQPVVTQGTGLNEIDSINDNSQNFSSQISKNQKINKKMTKVDFFVKCVQTKIGERVAILGGIDELGNWDPKKAIFLETSAESFPNWQVSLQLPTSKVIEYKYIIVSFVASPLSQSPVQTLQDQQLNKNIFQAQNIQIFWEQLGKALQNRRLSTIGKKEIILKEEINNEVVIEEYLEDTTEKDLNQFIDNKQKISLLSGIKLNQYFPLTTKTNSDQALNLQQNFNSKILSTKSKDLQKLGDIALNQNFQQSNKNQTSQIEFKQQNFKSEDQKTLQETQDLKNLVENPLNLKLISKQSSKLSQFVDSPQKEMQTKISKQITQENKMKKDNKEYSSEITQKQEVQSPPSIQELKATIPTPKVQEYRKRLNSNMSRKVEDEEIFRTKEIKIDPQEPIIMASFLLPYTIQRDEKTNLLKIQNCFHNPTIMYGTLEKMIQKKEINFKWVGLVTTLEDVTEAEKLELNAQFKEKGAYPIFMTAEETLPFLLFYENNIRPLFHNFKDLYNMQNESVKYWSSYVALNQKFAQKIMEVKNELGQMAKQIFIHNNHLLLVPSFVKKQFEEANIGLYFHSPFPSSAHFRIAKFRFEIIKSLLHCDLIGFHLFVYARNFIKTVQRLCGFELEFLPGGYFGIDFHGKRVLIRVAHVGIDQSFIEELMITKNFKTQQTSFNNAIQRHITQTKKLNYMQTQNGESEISDKPIIICSIDSYHPMAGLKHKLLSYKLFLQRYPNYRRRIVLIQFVGSILQAFDFAQDHQKQLLLIKEMRNEVIKIRDEIHQQFGPGCLVFSESNPPLEKRLALWAQSNIILVSALKDGLCIQLLEYVVCRKIVGKFSESAMICSEFAGCSEAMKGVYMFNPFSITDFPEQLDIAISQSPEINQENMNLAYQYVCRSSMTDWTFEFLKDLKYAYQPAKATFYLGLNLNSQAGKGLNFGIRLKSDFKRLNIDACYNSLVKANKSVIIIEIEAMPHHKFSQNSLPTVEVIEQLYSIMNDNRNIVLIISNHTQQTLEELFLKGRSAGVNGNHFWLAAESGYLFKTGGSNLKRGSEWQKQTQLDNLSWMNKVKLIMNEFEKNIDGSYIEQRQSCILWNYKNADKEQSMLFIHDLYNQIQKSLQEEPIEIIQGNGYLQVKPVIIKKQTLIQLMLKTVIKNSKIDFIFYLGNTSEDELVFEYLKSESANNQYFTQDCEKFLCVLEKKPSEADYYLEDQDSVRPLLSKLQTATQHRKKNRSYADLSQITNNLTPIQTRKLGAQNQSIANLSQYINTGIDSNVQKKGQSYFNKQLHLQKTLIEMPDIKEESDESLDIQQISKKIKENTPAKKINEIKNFQQNEKIEDFQKFQDYSRDRQIQFDIPTIHTFSAQVKKEGPNSLNQLILEPIEKFENRINKHELSKTSENTQQSFQNYNKDSQDRNKTGKGVSELNNENSMDSDKNILTGNTPVLSQTKSEGFPNLLKTKTIQNNQQNENQYQSNNFLLSTIEPKADNKSQESFSDLNIEKVIYSSYANMIGSKIQTHEKKKEKDNNKISGAVSVNSSKARFQNQLKTDKFNLDDFDDDDQEESIQDDDITDLKAQSLNSKDSQT